MNDFYEYVDSVKLVMEWFESPPIEVSRRTTPVMDKAWPASQAHFSQIWSVFIGQFRTLTQFNKRDRWIIRDGPVGLKRLFRKQPFPIGLRSRLYVHGECLSVVPPAWRSHIGGYRLVSMREKTEPSCLLFTGSGWHKDHSVYELKQWLGKTDLRGLRESKKIVFLPFKGVPEIGSQTYAVEYLSVLLSNLGEFETRGWWDLAFQASFKDTQLLNLSSRRYCADNFMEHLVLGKGGQLPTNVPVKAEEEFIALSPFHGYALLEPS